MSVIVEFTLSNEGFVLGRALAADQDVDIVFERVISVDGSQTTYFWVIGDDPDETARHVRASPLVESLTTLDDLGDRALYGVQWTASGSDSGLLASLRRASGAVLAAETTRNGRWWFKARFVSREALGEFYRECRAASIMVEIEQIYQASSETVEPAAAVNALTESQREVLEHAVEAGYFAIPREASLGEVAADLEVSQQAVSETLRRGVHRILHTTVRA